MPRGRAGERTSSGAGRAQAVCTGSREAPRRARSAWAAARRTTPHRLPGPVAPRDRGPELLDRKLGQRVEGPLDRVVVTHMEVLDDADVRVSLDPAPAPARGPARVA